MDTLIKKETQSRQLADEIERKIKKGELSPGFKLPSFREISATYQVSFQVVKSATTILERRSLVVCEPRVGIYVNPKALTPLRKNLATLCVKTVGGMSYIDQRLSFSSPPLWTDYCVTRYEIPVGAESTSELAYEVERIANGKPDCLLVFLPALKTKGLALFKKLRFPVIFIGDFHDGIPPRVANQIVEDTSERARAFVKCAHTRGLRDVVMMAGGPPDDRYYIRILAESGAARAKELGIRFRYSPFRDCGFATEEDFLAARVRAIAEVVAQGGSPDGLLVESLARTDLLIEALKRNRLRVPKDVKIVTSFEIHPGTTYVQYDCSAFGRRVQELIEQLVAEPARPLGRLVLPAHLIAAHFLKVS